MVICPDMSKTQNKFNPDNYRHQHSVNHLQSCEGDTESAIEQHFHYQGTAALFGFHQGHLVLDFIRTLVQIWAKEQNSRPEVRLTALDTK
eukprot:g21547.t1